MRENQLDYDFMIVKQTGGTTTCVFTYGSCNMTPNPLATVYYLTQACFKKEIRSSSCSVTYYGGWHGFSQGLRLLDTSNIGKGKDLE